MQRGGDRTVSGRTILVIILLVVLSVTTCFGVIATTEFITSDRTPMSLCISVCAFIPLSVFLAANGVRVFRKSRRLSYGALAEFVFVGLIVILAAASVVYAATYYRGCDDRIGPGAQLSTCAFEGRDFTGIDLHGANLQSANLQNAILRQVNLSSVNFTGANLSGADLTDAQLDGVVLDNANLEGVTGLTDEILAGALNVALDDLAVTTSQKHIRLEPRDEILRVLKDVCNGQGVPGTRSFADDGAFHSLVLLNAQGDSHQWSDLPLDKGWEPMALRFTDLVACVEHEEAGSIETCDYSGGPPITRYQYRVHMRLIVARTGELVDEGTVSGSVPGECPARAPASQTEINGDNVTRNDLAQWFTQFVKAPE
jgi:uncharacterized protein YjbI with pentapeptide repeats